jgi:hypothetical protein
MNFNNVLYATALSTLLYSPVFAATKIVSSNEQNNVVSMVIGNKIARVNSEKENQYMLMDFNLKKFIAVDTERNSAIDMSESMNAQLPVDPSATPALPVTLKKIGDGPTIAGFETVHYQMFAGDQYCDSVYLSSEASKLPNLEDFIAAMSDMSQSKKPAMQTKDSSTCDKTRADAGEEYLKIGMPMKIVTADNKMQMLIQKVDPDFNVADNYFNVPDGVQVMTMEELMKKMQQMMIQQMQKQQADPNR